MGALFNKKVTKTVVGASEEVYNIIRLCNGDHLNYLMLKKKSASDPSHKKAKQTPKNVLHSQEAKAGDGKPVVERDEGAHSKKEVVDLEGDSPPNTADKKGSLSSWRETYSDTLKPASKKESNVDCKQTPKQSSSKKEHVEKVTAKDEVIALFSKIDGSFMTKSRKVK